MKLFVGLIALALSSGCLCSRGPAEGGSEAAGAGKGKGSCAARAANSLEPSGAPNFGPAIAWMLRPRLPPNPANPLKLCPRPN